jgi:hypothetical protein
MVAKHGILVLFATHALSALAFSIGPVTLQDSGVYLASDQMDFDAGLKAAPTGSPQVNLDDAVFVGTRLGVTDQFLGIPYAHPP